MYVYKKNFKEFLSVPLLWYGVVKDPKTNYMTII